MSKSQVVERDRPKLRSLCFRPDTYERMVTRKGRLSFTEFLDVLLNAWDELPADKQMKHVVSPSSQNSAA